MFPRELGIGTDKFRKWVRQDQGERDARLTPSGFRRCNHRSKLIVVILINFSGPPQAPTSGEASQTGLTCAPLSVQHPLGSRFTGFSS
jgi:hypothetical protein